MPDVYNLLIADDEVIIRDGLLSFCWDRLGFQAVCAVSNGKKALEYMEKEQIDLVITDIKMPVMDGLELSRKIQKNYPSCKIIILSGYRDFDYAKEALKSGVSEYLLKPVDLGELEDLVKRLKLGLDQDKTTSFLVQNYEKMLPMAEKEFLSKLAKRQLIDLFEIEEEAGILELSIDRPYFCCAVFRINFSDSIEENRQFILNNVCDSFKNFYEENDIGYFFIDDNNDIVCILNFQLPCSELSTHDYIIQLTNFHQKLISACLAGKSFVFLGAAGNIYNSIISVSASYQEAIQALNNRFFSEDTRLFFTWEDNSVNGNRFTEYPFDIENSLINAIVDGNKQESLACLDAFWESFHSSLKLVNAVSIKTILMQLLTTIDQKMAKFGLYAKDIYGSDSLYDYLNTFSTLKSLQSGIKECVSIYCQKIQDLNESIKSSSHYSIQQAIKYIKEHYSEKITLELIAKEVLLSPCYLSIQFKKETGRNFIDYLKEYRIEKAKELLQRGDLMVYEIGAMIGYHNPKYFTDTFKSSTGITPLEYKQKLSIPTEEH